ncbi:MAG: hypothetical protein KC445_11420 [Anaerolineales bacterium]|nr:hypothetical protein [Anaerolineales bacterium]
MKSRHLIFLLVLLTFFAGCSGDERPTPTPFSEDGIVEETPSGAPLEISISDLAADPEAYADTLVRISGKFRRLPLLVCENDPHPAPATWQLVAEDGSLVALGGFDSQVRSLLPNDLTMTASGIWQLFDGPVGCGKSASSTQIWYLKVSDIVSPSPIARVTLTPTGSGSQIAATGGEGDGDGDTAVSTPDENGNLPPTATSADGSAPNSTPTSASNPTQPSGGSATQTPTSGTGGTGGSGGSGGASGGTPTGTPSPTFTIDPNETSTVTPVGSSGTATPTAGSGTATATSSSGGSNPTPTTAVLTTATSSPNNFDIIEFDDLSSETPILELLSQNEAHHYPIIFDYTGTITVTAIGESTMNLVLEIIDQTNDVVQQANSGGDGALETIANAQLNIDQDYQIRVYDLNAVNGDYCLIFNEDGGYPDTIKGRISYEQTVNNTLNILGISYWCFLGTFEDDVTISVSPTGSAGDLAVALFGPPDFTSIGDVYADSIMSNVILPDDGMFMIGVLDFEALEKVPYSLTLTQN